MPQKPNFALLEKGLETDPVKTKPPGGGPDFAELDKELEEPQSRSALGFAGNVLKSGGKLVGDIASAVAHPIDTVKGIGKLAVGLGEKAISPILTDPDNPTETEGTQMVDALFKHMSDRFGGIENIKKTAYEDPIGLAADISTIFSGLAGGVRMTGRAAGVSNVLSKAGAVTDPIQATLKLGGKAASGTGKLARGVTSFTTGADKASIQTAFAEHSKDFTKALRGEITWPDVMENMKQAFQEVKSARDKTYEPHLRTNIDLSDVHSTMAENLQREGVKVRASYKTKPTPADVLAGNEGKRKSIILTDDDDIAQLLNERKLPDGTAPPGLQANLDFQGSPLLHTGEESKIATVFKDIWRHKGRGGEVLRRQIYNNLSKSKPEAATAVPVAGQGRQVVESVHQSLLDALETEIPGFKEMTRPYQDTTNFLNDLRSDLALDKTGATAINRLKAASKSDNPYYQTLVEALDTRAGIKAKDQIAGLQLQPWKPGKFQHMLTWAMIRGISNPTHLFSPTFLMELAAFSPRAVGETANIAGKTSRVASKVGKEVTAGRYRPLTYIPPPPGEPK